MVHKAPHTHTQKFKTSNSTRCSVSTGCNETHTEESVNTKFLLLKH